MTDSLPERDILTFDKLCTQLTACGLEAGQTVVVHSSMSKIHDWIVGGVPTLINAFQTVLTEEGTLMMPTHTADNTDPIRWKKPPIPESWWQIVYDTMPAFDPLRTSTRYMGILPEQFRTYPNVYRSDHPIGSFAAWGKHAKYLTADHALTPMFGDGSPIGKLYELDGHIMLLGVPHANNTSIHLAEYRADFHGKAYQSEGCAMLVDGKRQWVPFEMLRFETDDFNTLGAAFEEQHPHHNGKLGQADVKFMRQRPLIDFAVNWMETNRDFRPQHND